MISTGSYVVNASVGAGDVANIAKGDQVSCHSRPVPTTPVFGLVSSIGIVASSSSGSSAFPVVISVTGNPAGLYAGSTANVSIIYRQLSNVLVVPTLAVTRNNGNAYVTAHGTRTASSPNDHRRAQLGRIDPGRVGPDQRRQRRCSGLGGQTGGFGGGPVGSAAGPVGSAAGPVGSVARAGLVAREAYQQDHT